MSHLLARFFGLVVPNLVAYCVGLLTDSARTSKVRVHGSLAMRFEEAFIAWTGAALSPAVIPWAAARYLVHAVALLMIDAAHAVTRAYAIRPRTLAG